MKEISSMIGGIKGIDGCFLSHHKKDIIFVRKYHRIFEVGLKWYRRAAKSLPLRLLAWVGALNIRW